MRGRPCDQKPPTEITLISADEQKYDDERHWMLDVVSDRRLTNHPGGFPQRTAGAVFVWGSFLHCKLQTHHHKKPHYEWNQTDCVLDYRPPPRPGETKQEEMRSKTGERVRYRK